MPSYKDSTTNTWYCQFYYIDWTGKRKHKVKRGFQRKKDAEMFEAKFKSSEAPNEITVGKLIDEYKDQLHRQYELGKIKMSTLDVKENYIRLYILPYFKDTKACEIKVKHIDEWLIHITAWQPRKGKDKKSHPTSKTKRSSMTVNTARQVFGQIFKFGIKNFGLKSDPTSLSERMKYHSNDGRADLWTADQFNVFFEALTKEHYRALFMLMFYSGLRIGEALVLTPADIEPGIIHITKTLVELHNGVSIINEPKTLHSARDVMIPPLVYERLQNYISMFKYIKPTDRIFPMREAAVRLYMDSVIARTGLPRISPHGLRHSYASILYNECKDLTVVAKQLGHANSDVTAKIYSHMLPQEDVKAALFLNALVEKTVEKL